jgi:hypothetical protein
MSVETRVESNLVGPPPFIQHISLFFYEENREIASLTRWLAIQETESLGG